MCSRLQHQFNEDKGSGEAKMDLAKCKHSEGMMEATAKNLAYHRSSHEIYNSYEDADFFGRELECFAGIRAFRGSMLNLLQNEQAQRKIERARSKAGALLQQVLAGLVLEQSLLEDSAVAQLQAADVSELAEEISLLIPS